MTEMGMVGKIVVEGHTIFLPREFGHQSQQDLSDIYLPAVTAARPDLSLKIPALWVSLSEMRDLSTAMLHAMSNSQGSVEVVQEVGS